VHSYEEPHRDDLVAQNYVSTFGLQGRQWKMAIKNAHGIVDKNWCALAEEIKLLITKHKGKWSEVEMHYAYWLNFTGKRLAELVAGKTRIRAKLTLTAPKCF
jgi:hypothetical protein